MTFDETLGERLRVAVPVAPDTGTWASAARRKRRRRQQAVGGVVAVALASVGGAAWLNSRPGPVVAEVASEAPLRQVDGELSECGAAPTGGSRLPRGATSITLCSDGTAFQRMWPPLDRLTTDVDRYVDQINSAEPLPADAACTSELGPAFKVVFTYPDGRHAVVLGQLYGCRRIGGDVSHAMGADALLDSLRDGWAAQRSAAPLVAEREGSWCPQDGDTPLWGGRSSMLPPTLDAIVAARVCQPHSGRPGQFEGPVPAQQVSELVADIEANARPGIADADRTGALLVLASPSGDLLTLAKLVDGRYVLHADPEVVWTPSAKSAAILADALR